MIRDPATQRTMNWDLPDEEAVTIAGLVIHEAQAIPEPGQRFAFHGYRFQVLRRQRNQLTALRVEREVEDEGSESRRQATNPSQSLSCENRRKPPWVSGTQCSIQSLFLLKIR